MRGQDAAAVELAGDAAKRDDAGGADVLDDRPDVGGVLVRVGLVGGDRGGVAFAGATQGGGTIGVAEAAEMLTSAHGRDLSAMISRLFRNSSRDLGSRLVDEGAHPLNPCLRPN